MTRHAELPVLPSVAPIVSKSRWVFFHPERIAAAVSEWGRSLQRTSSWEHTCHYFDGGEETVRWIFVLDVLNHCFWPDVGEPTWTVRYRNIPHSGYWGLAASLKRAVESGVPITRAEFLKDIPLERLKEVFAGEGQIPLLEQRLFNLREAGRILTSEWGGDIINLLKEAEGSATSLIRKVVSSFPSFRDEAIYRGRKVYFWKRAQIFAWDIHAAFGGKSWGYFEDIGKLTAFADYKLPQVLRVFGTISYDPDLARRIDSLQKLAPGSEEEVEIRAVTIWAVEELKRQFLEIGQRVTSTEVDNWLWQLGQLEPFRLKPYHRCRTIFY